jgi:hypothetical protein
MGNKTAAIQELPGLGSVFYDPALNGGVLRKIALTLDLPDQPDSTPFIPVGANIPLNSPDSPAMFHLICWMKGATESRRFQLSYSMAVHRQGSGALAILDQELIYSSGPVSDFSFDAFFLNGDSLDLLFINDSDSTGVVIFAANLFMKPLTFDPTLGGK